VLVTPFENRTDELLVGRQVDAALARELTSSGFVNLVPAARVDDVLRLMERPSGPPLTPAIAREVALRDGGIRAVIFGSIEKTDAGFMLTAGVLDPASNVQVIERQQEVRNVAIVAGVRNLSNALRASFGEARGRIRESNQQLEAVTTPSLQALTLYSESFRLGTQRDARSWEGAHALVTQALELDPEFPAARIWLAWSYSRQNRLAEARAQAKLAFDGAARATEWEQHWIRGSYHYICDDYAAAALEYEALLRLRPDDFWGVWNLSVAYTRLGRLTDAVNLVTAVSTTRPHDLIAQGWAVNAHIGAGHRAGATPYVRRIADLVNGRDDDERAQYWPLTALHDAHLAIERHDAVTAADLLDRATSDLLQAKPLLRLHGGWSLALAYLGIGRVKEARRAAALIPHDEFRRVLVARIALAAGAVRETRETLRQFTIERFFSTSPDFARTAVQMSLWTMLKAGLADETERQLAAWQGAAVPQPLPHQVEALRARIARLRGAEVEAERGLRAALSWVGLSALNIVRYSEPLADILRQRGDLIGEQAVLERAINLSTRFADTPYDVSLPMRLRLAAILRQLGDITSAERIEDELSRVLALADPGFPPLVALERQRRSKGDRSTPVQRGVTDTAYGTSKIPSS
jgi:tetratricopeptide (TPR) repeat protein